MIEISTLDIVIILVYLVVTLGIGLFLSRRESAEGFFVNNRKTKLFLLIFTSVSTAVGSGTVIGTASSAYRSGISFGLSFFIATLISWTVMAFLAPRIKMWGDKIQAYTFGDFLAVRYSESTRKLSAVIVTLAYFTITAAQFVAIASIAEVVGGISFETALAIAAMITITYTILAGIKGDFYTDAIQFFVMIPVFFFLFYYGLSNTGLSDLFKSLPAEFLSPTNYAGSTFFYGVIVFGFAILLVSVETWQRIFAAVDGKTVRKAFLISGVLQAAAIASATIFGLMAFQLVPGIDKDSAIFGLMSRLLPSGILGLGLASVLAILMSTVDSMLMVGSATLTKDFYLTKYPDADNNRKLFVGRLTVLIFGGAAFLVAFFVHDVLRLAVTSIQLLATFMPALLGGLLWQRANAKAAFWSILSGFLLTIILLPFLPDTAALPGVILSIVVFVMVSLRSSNSLADSQINITNVS